MPTVFLSKHSSINDLLRNLGPQIVELRSRWRLLPRLQAAGYL